MSCKKGCYEAVLQSCNNIVVRADFPANYPLYWIISKFGSANIHQRLVTTNVNGDLLISKTDLPLGYLLTGNFYKIEVKDGANYLQPVTFAFGTEQYTCIQAKFVNYTRDILDNSEVNVVEFKEPVVLGSTPNVSSAIIFPFSNQSSITFNHNLGRLVSVSVYNLAGEYMTATVTDDTVNHNFITVSFTSPSSGRLLIL